jgi:hypothetical protein
VVKIADTRALSVNVIEHVPVTPHPGNAQLVKTLPVKFVDVSTTVEPDVKAVVQVPPTEVQEFIPAGALDTLPFPYTVTVILKLTANEGMDSKQTIRNKYNFFILLLQRNLH